VLTQGAHEALAFVLAVDAGRSWRGQEGARQARAYEILSRIRRRLRVPYAFEEHLTPAS
jgi:hypothetical protein